MKRSIAGVVAVTALVVLTAAKCTDSGTGDSNPRQPTKSATAGPTAGPPSKETKAACSYAQDVAGSPPDNTRDAGFYGAQLNYLATRQGVNADVQSAIMEWLGDGASTTAYPFQVPLDPGTFAKDADKVVIGACVKAGVVHTS